MMIQLINAVAALLSCHVAWVDLRAQRSGLRFPGWSTAAC